MKMAERIKRINELYHKSRREGLTETEKAEQASERPDGSMEHLGEKFGNSPGIEEKGTG